MPDVMPDVVPDVMSDVMPDVMSDVMPDVMSDVMPDMIRHPWIAGAATPDPIRGRNDRADGLRRHAVARAGFQLPGEISPLRMA